MTEIITSTQKNYTTDFVRNLKTPPPLRQSQLKPKESLKDDQHSPC